MNATPLTKQQAGLEGPRDKQALRLWLRLLSCTNQIEREVRRRLRTQHSATLPRFDLMAALDRAPDGLTMGALSRRLMVSNGNVTGVVDRLEREGLVKRRAQPSDRRSYVITLTARGRAAFEEMAASHARWIDEMITGLSGAEIDTLMALLARTKTTVSTTVDGEDGS